MAEDNDSPRIVTPDGRSMALDDVIILMTLRAFETNEPVGFSGHTESCPMLAVEMKEDCYTCQHDQLYGSCKLGVPQTEDLLSSQHFYDTCGFACDQYKKSEDIVCNCGMDKTPN